MIVKGTDNGTTSDFDGNYSIRATSGDVLVFSYIGFLSGEVTVGSSDTINISLSQDAQALEEVIVTGFGNVSKQSFAGSAKVVAGENISQK